jgi:hypothetical protein
MTAQSVLEAAAAAVIASPNRIRPETDPHPPPRRARLLRMFPSIETPKSVAVRGQSCYAAVYPAFL